MSDKQDSRHEHIHTHEHDGHVHEHVHSHEYIDEHDHTEDELHLEKMRSKEESILNLLLIHWIEHNESHEENFKEWAEKAKNMGKDEVAKKIEEAILSMKKANELLREAKKYM